MIYSTYIRHAATWMETEAEIVYSAMVSSRTRIPDIVIIITSCHNSVMQDSCYIVPFRQILRQTHTVRRSIITDKPLRPDTPLQ